MQFRINSIDVHHAVYLLLISNLVTPLHFLELQIVNVIYIYKYVYRYVKKLVILWFPKNIHSLKKGKKKFRDMCYYEIYNIFG